MPGSPPRLHQSSRGLRRGLPVRRCRRLAAVRQLRGARRSGRLLGDEERMGSASDYRSRKVLDDGSVFFNSDAKLAPGDVNGVGDAYRWRDGKVSLISSGKSPRASTWVEATPDGHDVYFATYERLVAQDVDDERDIYDWRVGGGLARQNVSVPPAADCRDDACQGAVTSPPGSAPGIADPPLSAELPATVRAGFSGWPADAGPDGRARSGQEHRGQGEGQPARADQVGRQGEDRCHDQGRAQLPSRTVAKAGSSVLSVRLSLPGAAGAPAPVAADHLRVPFRGRARSAHRHAGAAGVDVRQSSAHQRGRRAGAADQVRMTMTSITINAARLLLCLTALSLAVLGLAALRPCGVRHRHGRRQRGRPSGNPSRRRAAIRISRPASRSARPSTPMAGGSRTRTPRTSRSTCRPRVIGNPAGSAVLRDIADLAREYGECKAESQIGTVAVDLGGPEPPHSLYNLRPARGSRRPSASSSSTSCVATIRRSGSGERLRRHRHLHRHPAVAGHLGASSADLGRAGGSVHDDERSSLDETNFISRRPIQHGVRRPFVDVADELLEAGAETTITANSWQTPSVFSPASFSLGLRRQGDDHRGL